MKICKKCGCISKQDKMDRNVKPCPNCGFYKEKEEIKK